MASSKFIRLIRDNDGLPKEDILVYLVPSGTAFNDSMPVEEHVSRKGYYSRAQVPDGEYDIYVDLGAGPVLYESAVWQGEKIISDLIDDLGTDNTNYNVSTSRHGLAPKLPSDATKFFDGTGAYDTVKDSDLSTSDVTVNNVAITKHGFVPKAPNDDLKFLDGTGNWDTIKEADLLLSDNFMGDVGIDRHGFCPKAPDDNSKFLDGEAVYDTVKDSDLSTSDITTNNVSTSKHGFAPKLPNDATKYLDGTGAFTVPAGSGGVSDAEFFPASGVFREYKDIIPTGEGYCKELLAPRPDPATAGYQTAEFEDCSELYKPVILEVGDFYYLYYCASTQKYQTDPADSDTDKRKSDFQRNNQVFLAWKRKENGLRGGGWQKWRGGRQPVIPIDTDIYGGGYEVGRIWLRSVIYSTILSCYVCAYGCDKGYDGSSHIVYWGFATSPDGIVWTKMNNHYAFLGAGDTSTLHSGALIEYGGYFYLFSSMGSSTLPSLYRSEDLVSWTLINSTMWTSTYYWIYDAKIYDGYLYVACGTSTMGAVVLMRIAVASIESAGSYTNLGTLFAGSYAMGECNGGIDSGFSMVNWCNIHKYDTDKWVIMYNYYKDRFARYNVVKECGIREFSFGSSTPMPGA